MPTVILLDVSLSMSRPVPDADGGEEQTRKQLAKHGINVLLDHLASKLKLEFVSLVIFSSLWEQVVGFTRDYDAIRAAVEKVDVYNKTCVETALRGVTSLCVEEWTSSISCQVILITDGNPGFGDGSLKKSLQNYSQQTEQQAAEETFPLPFQFPCKLQVMCLAPSSEKTLDISLPLFEKLIEINNDRGQVFAPDGNLSVKSVEQMFKSLSDKYFMPLHGSLECGNLKCGVHIFPAPDPYDSDHDFEHVARDPSRDLTIVGFLDISDVSSPPYLSRHLVLPIPEAQKTQEKDTDKSAKKEEEEETEESKTAAFTVLLHGSLKVETMAALTQLGDDWYGLLYSWADSKKKANLMLSMFRPGEDVVPWLGSLQNLAPISEFPENPYGENDRKTPFPIRPSDRRSYTQNCVVWIKQAGLQADIQKILRNAKKIPEKQQHFYKELNRLRRAALSFGFHNLLEAVAQLLERERSFLPGNAHPDAAMQLTHAATALRNPSALDFQENIMPMRTNFNG